MVPVFSATVSDSGKLQLDGVQRRAMDLWLSTLAGKPVVVSIKQERATRSSAQNRYWWGVVVPCLAEHCGYTHDEMHEALKYKFLRMEAEAMPADLPKMRSTATLTTKEFTDLIENVIAWAGADLGVMIPLPNEVAHDGDDT